MMSGNAKNCTETVTTNDIEQEFLERVRLFQASRMAPRDDVNYDVSYTKEHPKAVGIVLGLDTTASMLPVSKYLIEEGFMKVVYKIKECGTPDAKVLFMGIGDHRYDVAPLQVGMFEFETEAMDKWLKSIYLEGGGGDNDGESYLLAWRFAKERISLNCCEYHNNKGFLCTVGDEPTLMNIPGYMPSRFPKVWDEEFNETAEHFLRRAHQNFHIFHVHVNNKSKNNDKTIGSWEKLLGDNLMVVDNYTEIPECILSQILRAYSEEPQFRLRPPLFGRGPKQKVGNFAATETSFAELRPVVDSINKSGTSLSEIYL